MTAILTRISYKRNIRYELDSSLGDFYAKTQHKSKIESFTIREKMLLYEKFPKFKNNPNKIHIYYRVLQFTVLRLINRLKFTHP